MNAIDSLSITFDPKIYNEELADILQKLELREKVDYKKMTEIK